MIYKDLYRFDNVILSTGATVNHILLREIFKCFNILTCRVNIHVELDKLFCLKFFINRMKFFVVLCTCYQLP